MKKIFPDVHTHATILLALLFVDAMKASSSVMMRNIASVGILIVNNYPVTKNKLIYHARISKHDMASFQRDNSVYFWSQGSYSLYNATKADRFREKTCPM